MQANVCVYMRMFVRVYVCKSQYLNGCMYAGSHMYVCTHVCFYIGM